MAKKKKAGAKKTSKVAKKAKAGSKKVAKKKVSARGAPRPAAKKKAAKKTARKAVKKAAPKAAKKAAKKAVVKKAAAPRRPKPVAPPPPPLMEEPRPLPEEELPGAGMPGFEEPGPGGASVLDVESEIQEGPTLYEPDEPRSEEESEEEDDDEDLPRGRRRASPPAPAAAQHAASSLQEHAELRPGMPAPDFALSDETGEMHTLASYRGRRVVLYFYPKDDTPGCTREACGFRDTLDHFEQRNTVVLGVSPDAPESHAAFAKKHNLTFPLLADESHAVAERYGAWGEKRSRGGQVRLGILRTSFVIDEAGRIAHVFHQVNPVGHEQEILDFLDQMPRPV